MRLTPKDRYLINAVPLIPLVLLLFGFIAVGQWCGVRLFNFTSKICDRLNRLYAEAYPEAARAKAQRREMRERQSRRQSQV